MTADSLFSLAGMIVTPAWILLAVAPRWRWTERIVHAGCVSLLIGVLYVWLLVAHWGDSDGGFGSIAQVRELFSTDYVLLAGWVHYLAFDLFIGAWEVRDAKRTGVPHLAVIPCLFLTFMFGPGGLLLYFVLRWSITKRFAVADVS